MRNRRPRDRQLTDDDVREHLDRIAHDNALREAERQREEQRKAAIVAAEWQD